MKIQTTIFAAVLVLAGCQHAADDGWTRSELSAGQVAEVEQRVPALRPGMTDNDILDHLGILEGGYISGGITGGPHSHYRTTYRVGEAGVLTIVRNRTNLTEVVFWNRATGKKTTVEMDSQHHTERFSR